VCSSWTLGRRWSPPDVDVYRPSVCTKISVVTSLREAPIHELPRTLSRRSSVKPQGLLLRWARDRTTDSQAPAAPMEGRGPRPFRSHVRRSRRDEVHAQDDDQGRKLPAGRRIHKPLGAEGVRALDGRGEGLRRLHRTDRLDGPRRLAGGKAQDRDRVDARPPLLGARSGYRGGVGQRRLRVRGARLGAHHQHNATRERRFA